MTRLGPQRGNRPPQGGFRLDQPGGKLFGVCAGIANWLGTDPMLVRIGFVLAALLGIGAPVLIYLAIALIAD